jgi:metallophosphoesterase (TIGR00282 family)
MPLRVLFIGDVVGKPGRAILAKCVPRLIERWDLDLVVANAENSAGGSGLTAKCYGEITAAGVDVLTMGDHVYRKKDILPLLEEHGNICRPANFPREAPGAEFTVAAARDGTPVAVFCLLGRLFMMSVDCPFRAADRVLEQIGGQARCILVDMHAEATSEKQIMGRYLDGRVAAVLGTHTHVATADEQILPGGTAYQTDCGMTGPYESILGRRIDRVTQTTLSFVPSYFDVAEGDPRLSGTRVDLDRDTGHALAIQRVMIDEAAAEKL